VRHKRAKLLVQVQEEGETIDEKPSTEKRGTRVAELRGGRGGRGGRV